MDPKVKTTTLQNALILSNISAMIYGIIAEIGQEHISRTISDDSLTKNRLESAVVSKLYFDVQRV